MLDMPNGREIENTSVAAVIIYIPDYSFHHRQFLTKTENTFILAVISRH